MIKLENVVLPSPEQWEAIIRGMRNPKNSWDRSDSYEKCIHAPCHECNKNPTNVIDCEYFGSADYEIGPYDHKLMSSLAAGGPVHAKYRRMITVYLDITAPLYWWKEFDTYKVGTVANSCSTMHKIHDKEFTLEDFSCEHLGNAALSCLEGTIGYLNVNRQYFVDLNDKKHWWQMIQLLPSSYNQKRTIMLNYEVLAGIYPMRKNHKLDEWVEFCEWIDSLPYSELITGKEQ